MEFRAGYLGYYIYLYQLIWIVRRRKNQPQCSPMGVPFGIAFTIVFVSLKGNIDLWQNFIYQIKR